MSYKYEYAIVGIYMQYMILYDIERYPLFHGICSKTNLQVIQGPSRGLRWPLTPDGHGAMQLTTLWWAIGWGWYFGFMADDPRWSPFSQVCSQTRSAFKQLVLPCFAIMQDSWFNPPKSSILLFLYMEPESYTWIKFITRTASTPPNEKAWAVRKASSLHKRGLQLADSFAAGKIHWVLKDGELVKEVGMSNEVCVLSLFGKTAMENDMELSSL